MTAKKNVTVSPVDYQIDWKDFKVINLCITLRQCMSGGGAEREGDTESEAGPRLHGVSTEPDTGLEPTNHEIMT